MRVFRGIQIFATHVVLSALIGTTAFLTVGCGSQKPYSQANGDVAVKIPVVKEGKFTLNVVTLLGVDDLFELQGKFAQFFFSPRMENGQLAGEHAKARFISAGGVYIPADTLSGEMASIYYQLQTLAKLDDEVGAAGVNQWPRSVGVHALVVNEKGQSQENNAMYDGQSDSITFVPYSNPSIPISVNPGIIAHEHFHSLFYKLVTKPLVNAQVLGMQSLVSLHALEGKNFTSFNKPTPQDDNSDERDIYHWFVMKGLNEGLADVWGWAYTGQPDFIAFSLPSEKTRRTLEAQSSSLKIQTKEYVLQNIVRSNLVKDYETGKAVIKVAETKTRLIDCCAYTFGTTVSRFFKSYSDIKGNQKAEGRFSAQAVSSRKEIMKVIVKLLPLIEKNMEGLGEDQYFDPSSIVELTAEADTELNQEGCEFMVSFLKNSWAGTNLSPQYACKTVDGKLKLTKQDNSAQ